MCDPGKKDFILFEDLDEAVARGKRLVVVAPLGGWLGRQRAVLAVFVRSELEI